MSTARVQSHPEVTDPAGEVLELTAAQLGIWNAQRLEPDSRHYLVGDVLEIRGPGPVDVAALAEAVRATTEEAESLRLRVFDTPDGPRQIVSSEPVRAPRIVDLRAERDPAAAARATVDAERVRAAEACRAMVDRPLYHQVLLRLSEREVHYVQLGHHLIFDGYSAAMLCRRIAAHHTALVGGTEVAPSTFGRFADLVEADLAYRAGERFTTDRDHWRDRLTPLPDLGATGAPAGPPDRTLTARTVLGPDRVDRLRAVADDAHVTWGEVLIACYAAFLHRVTGASDVVFALPLMCRSGRAALRTPAMAVNVLPLRVDVRGGDRLGELSRRTADAMREMRAHQRYRGEDLPRDVPGAGALLHGRGVNLKAFDFAIELAGATGVLRNVAGGPPEDFGLTATPTADGGLLLGFEVDARTHAQHMVDERLDALTTLMEQLPGPGLPPVGRVALLTPDRREQLLGDRAVPPLPGPAPDVPTLLADLAGTHPDRTALVAGDERTSTADLVARVHRLARVLRSRGAGPDVVVALALPRSTDLVVALLAVLDAGAAFLVLDTDHAEQRLRGILDDARPALLVTTGAFDAEGPARLVLDGAETAADRPGDPLSSTDLAADRDPEHLAYVIYTSGSTGRPKGVLGRAGGLAALVHHHRSTIVAEAERDAGRPLRVAHTYSFSFDAALDQLTWLLCGHELHLYESDLVRDADALLAAYARDRIDVVDTTPSLAAPLVEAGLLDLPLRLLILGGEATPDALWRRVHASGVPARNLYGPTEATVDATAARVDDGAPTIGFPLAGTRAYLLDTALAPVPHGAPGELYLAGPHLARGYLGRPDLTADRFVADPFAGPGERMYRTGDRATWVPGRGIVHLGRDDGQVKIRGYRVEIGEVEAGLAAVPGVAAAAAVVRTDGGRTRLVGYVVPAAEAPVTSARRVAPPARGPLTPDGVREALAAGVPDHLVPSAVVVLDALPVTVNGKLDRAALPVPRLESTGREPGTERERLVCGVVAEVFDLDRVGVDEDFFALGGDSITAISVSSRLRALGLDLRPRDLLARRTLASLAAGAGEVDGAADTAPDDPTGPVPAPPIVRALLDPHPDLAAVAGYAQWTALRVDEPLSLPDLVAGVQTVLDRHDALRLLVTGGDGAEPAELMVRPRGAVAAAGVVRETRAEEDSDGGDDTGANGAGADEAGANGAGGDGLVEEALASLAATLAGELAPRSGDLLRVALVRTGEEQPDRLLVLAHHLVADGVSWRILLPDLHEACTVAASGRTPEPAPAGTSWRRHATLLAEQGESHTRAPELEHWRRAAAGDQPGDHLGERGLDSSRDTVATAARTVTTASAEVTDALVTTLPAAYRAGVHEVLLTAVALALRTWRAETGRPATDTSTITVEGHGRDHGGLDLSRTVGWFTAEYPVRVPSDAVREDTDLADALAGGPAAGRLLRAVKESLRAVPDGGIGYGVLRHLDPHTRDELTSSPPPDVLLNYLGRFAASPGAGWRLPEGAAFAVVEPPAKALEQVLALNCFVHERGAPRLSVEWTAAGRVLGPDVVAALQRHYDTALGALAAHAARVGPDGGGLTPSDLPLVDLDQDGIDALEREHHVDDVLPATALQVGLSFHSLVRGEGDTDVYVVQAVTSLAGALDPDRMRRATAELLRRHPSLRIGLAATTSGDVVQVVPRSATPEFRHVDTSCRPVDDLAEHLAQELRRPFDPARPPLIRFLLCTLAPDEHRLAITNHHALLDGWSMPLVGRTLLAIYAELGGGPAVPAPVGVADYFRWLDGRDHDASRAAWRDLLAGVEDGTRLAPSTAGEAVVRPGRVRIDLGTELSADLRAFARDRGITLTSVLQTAWGLLLGRLTGRDDVVFGCPVSGRPAEVPGVESMIGQLGNTIPVRVRCAPADTVADVLDAVHAQGVAMAEHHHVGLPDVQRDAGVGDLFDTMLVMENFPLSSRNRVPLAPGLDLTGVDITDATHYPLTVIVIPEETVVVGLGYQPHAFTEETVRDYGRWLQTLLREIVTGPDRPSGRLPLLEPDERDRLLRTGTERVPRVPRRPCLEEFAAQVARRPDHEAVVCRDRSLTYAELDRRANRLAHRLIASGVAPQDAVAVLLERDVEMVVAILGVLRAGAVYVPMDASYPADRLAFMLDDIVPAAAVTTGAALAQLGCELPTARPVPLVRLDEPAGHLPETDPVQARRGLTEDALAYVIYTSGTTGRPKGVAVTHRGIPDLVALQEEVVGVTPDIRYLHFASTSFDVAFWQTMVPLLSGGTSVIAPEEVRSSGDDLLDYIAAQRCTGVNLLPSFLAAMPDDRTIDPDVLLMVGAERLDPELARRWGARRSLLNAYGPTEVTINATMWHYDPDDPGPLPIGRPDPNVRAYVLDAGLMPVGVGVPGELYLAGPGVARGYVGRPGLTAGAFVADPFGEPGTRMYRTGDRVHWRRDGHLVFLGRTDHQIKIRGFRVELSEIETVLARAPGVRACVVLVREDRPGDRRLVGYVVPTDGAEPSPERLRADLGEVLPGHMVPSALLLLERLPLNPAGKLDRSALPAPDNGSGVATREPATPAEETLLEILREVLGTDQVHVDDAFLDVGGDSIVSLQVVSRARRRGLVLTARDVFEGGTVAGIAARAVTDAPSSGDAGPVAGDAPLTPVMRDLLERCAAAGTTADGFCQWTETTVPAGGDRAGWEAVLTALLDRHDVLRSHLAAGTGGGAPVLRIPAAGTVTGADVLTVVEVPAGSERRALADSHTAASRDAMDLYRGPLLRAIWLDAGPDAPGRLVLVAHHMVVDGVSWRILLDDLRHAHESRTADGGVPVLARRGLSFPAWSQALAAAADARRDELAHWRSTVDAPDTPLSVTAPDPRRDTVATATHHEIRLDAATTHAVLTALPAAFRTTPDTVLLTALTTAMGAGTGGPGLLVARESHGRPGHLPDRSAPVDLSQTVGWFTAVHPARIRPDRRGGAHALKSVKEQLHTAGDGLGHGILRDADLLDGGTEPRISVNYLGRFPSGASAETPWQTPPDADPLGSGGRDDLPLPHSLMVNALASDSGGDTTLGIRFTWPSALFTRQRMEQIAERLRGALTALAGDPTVVAGAGLTPSDVDLVPIDQRTIDALERAHPVTAILPLTPLQELMLRHSRQRRGVADPYTVQAAFTLDGALDGATLHAAGADLLRRHPNLGAVFPVVPDGIQVLLADPRPDTRLIEAPEADDHEVDHLLDADLAEPFDLGTGPPVRITVIRRGPARSVFVLTTHHVLSDGWSAPRMLGETFALYTARRTGTPDVLPAPVPFERYLRWRAGCDHDAALRHWAGELAGLPEGEHVTGDEAARRDGTRIPPAHRDDTRVPATRRDDTSGTVLARVPAERVAALTAAATGAGVTPGTLLQGAWAAVLAAHSGRTDVCFGAMVSGRSPDVDGVEEILGLLAGTLPVRVRLDDHATLGALLADLQRRHQDNAERHDVGLPALERLTGRSRLFDSLLVFENYPVDPDAMREPAPGLRVVGTRFREATHHPVSVTVVPAPTRPGPEPVGPEPVGRGPEPVGPEPEEGDWIVVLAHRPESVPAERARRLADDLLAVLGRLARPSALTGAPDELLAVITEHGPGATAPSTGAAS